MALAIAQEALRIEPAVGQIFRRATSATRFGDVDVPAGTTVNLQIGATTKRTGPGVGVFDPGYWLRATDSHGAGSAAVPAGGVDAAAAAHSAEARPNKEAGNLVFGTGPRRCVGQHLATTELLTLLAAFGRCVGSLDMEEKDADAVFIATEPHPTGLPVRITPR